MSVNEYATVTEAIDGLKRRGFSANFEFTGDAVLDVERKRRYAAADLTVVEHHRFEGETDPGDMAIVYALVGRDGARGVLVAPFGAYTEAGLGAFLGKVTMHEQD